jgi:hypothetical protein
MIVKIFEKKYYHELEREINNFLKTTDTTKIVDIKYSGCGYSVPHGTCYYSAMIIMK